MSWCNNITYPSPHTRTHAQLDPRHSFDTDLAIDKARFQVKLAVDYHGIPRESLVLKIPGCVAWQFLSLFMSLLAWLLVFLSLLA